VTLDVETIKQDFPGLSRVINGHEIAFLDSGASSQTPVQVLEAMNHAYNDHYANVHRGVYTTAQEISNEYENARKKVAAFINASTDNEVIFTRNATEGINLVARTWGDDNISEGDVIVLSYLEHHSNIVPWQQLAQRTGAVLKYIGLDDEARFDLSNFDELISGAKLLAITAASNVTGTIIDVAPLIKRAHEAGALALIDACQFTPHHKTDVQSWDADFVAFSAHKMLGPTGLGVLYAKEALLESMPPFLGGGSMITDVTEDTFEPAELPAKFEAGTPAFIEAIGTAAAIDYLQTIGFETIEEHERVLTQYALDMFKTRFSDSVVIHGPKTADQRLGVVSFTIEGVHPHDVSQLLDEYGVCVRAGHHCAKPLMRVLRSGDNVGIGATSRASMYLYNDTKDVDALGDAVEKCIAFFGV
jgi:cysteine desulfurase/selenocysteine lyase